MAALTQERDTKRRTGDLLSLPVAAGVRIFAGSLVARDADGNAVPGRAAANLLGAGRAADSYDNSAGAAGAISAEIQKGIFAFANSAAADAITRADIGTDCFIVDDQTVAKTNGGSARSVAGRVFDVDHDGVWVDLR